MCRREDAYLRAKAAADADLVRRPLDWTILRPGRLTDAPGAGLVRLGPAPLPAGEVPRDDVAAVLLALLDRPSTARMILDLTAGPDPVAEALGTLPSVA